MSLLHQLVPSLAEAAEGSPVVLTGEEARHAMVRRIRAGERVALADGEGRVAVGVCTASTKQMVTFTVEQIERYARPEPRIMVVQALPKGDRGTRAVELLTEVGVDVVVPWQAERCVESWRGERGRRGLDRWRATARQATKQSCRAWSPEVTDLMGLSDVIEMVAAADLAVVLHEEAIASLPDPPQSGAVVIVVGPEGGLSPTEVATLVDAGGAATRLGREVLRTSTAGAVATAVLSARTPRWR